MRAAERGLLLLCSDLGDMRAHPISLGRFLALRQAAMTAGVGDQDPTCRLSVSDLRKIGCSEQDAAHLVWLLEREDALERYLAAGAERGIFPVTRLSPQYPVQLIKTLGDRCPPVLFCAGDPSLFFHEGVSLVGSRDLAAPGRQFAETVGRLAAEENLALISGGARGADSAAQHMALQAGGTALIYLAASLWKAAAVSLPEGLLLCSERSFTQDFTVLRASARNRLIHAMGQKVFVAQTACSHGGTFTGTVENLAHGWSPVFVHSDGSAGARELCTRGAVPVALDELHSLRALVPTQRSFW